MLVHRARADAQDLADLAVGLAVADPQQDLGFAFGQAVAQGEQPFFGPGANLGEAEQPFVRGAARQQAEFDAAVADIVPHDAVIVLLG